MKTAAETFPREQTHVGEQVRKALDGFLLALAASNPEMARRCADNATSVLHCLPESRQLQFLLAAIALSDLPEGAAEFFCGCADLTDYLTDDNLRAWVEEGRTAGGGKPGAAVAFFRRESLAGVSSLRKLRRSVHLDDVRRLLQLYCTAITGKPLSVKNTEEAPRELVREGHHLPLTDGKTIYLPDRFEKLRSREENFSESKVLAAHQAGYIEFGTFELDIDAALDHPIFIEFAVKDRGTESETLVSHYELFFRLFDDAQLARDIFFAIEDGRVDFRLRERYRGLAADMEKVARASLESRPAPRSLPLKEALVECLIRLSITAEIDESLPEEILPVYRYMCGIFGQALNNNATVTDSAVAAARIYLLLGAIPNIMPESPGFGSAIRELQRVPPKKLQGGIPEGSGFSESDARSYQPSMPVAFRGQTKPELVQLENAIELLKEAVEGSEGTGVPLTREMLEMLLKQGVKIKISQMSAKELAETSGLFITDLGGVVQEKIGELSPDARKKLARMLEQASVVKTQTEDAARVFLYDEWDYLIGDYRSQWCRLREVPLEGDSSAIVEQIRKERSALILAVRRRFERIRPEMLRRIKRLRTGEEIELNDAIEAVVDRRAGLTPSERIYQKRDRRMRDVATAFLLDLSASTDEWIVEEPERGGGGGKQAAVSRSPLMQYFGRGASAATEELSPPDKSKRVIDVEREALVIMCESLESLGDMYAIYGFSGYGRDNVEFFTIKDFSETYSERVRRRIGAIKPQKSTRMGPAIRHTLRKLAATDCRLKVLILLSDGYPQDHDYGPDRASRDYGLHDTTVALQEARKRKAHTFCVTVDQAGNDYLRAMCGGENYLVVKKPSALPRILPRVYRGLTI